MVVDVFGWIWGKIGRQDRIRTFQMFEMPKWLSNKLATWNNLAFYKSSSEITLPHCFCSAHCAKTYQLTSGPSINHWWWLYWIPYIKYRKSNEKERVFDCAPHSSVYISGQQLPNVTREVIRNENFVVTIPV